jgi:hypothetical protein
MTPGTILGRVGMLSIYLSRRRISGIQMAILSILVVGGMDSLPLIRRDATVNTIKKISEIALGK